MQQFYKKLRSRTSKLGKAFIIWASADNQISERLGESMIEELGHANN